MSVALSSGSTLIDRRVTDAALALFDRVGYENVDELDIALRAGITVGQLRERFVDKQEVLGTIVDRATDSLFWQPLDVGALDPPEALAVLMLEHLRLIAVDERVARVVIREHRHLRNPYRRSWASRTARYRERWMDAALRLTPSASRPQAQIVVMATLGTLNTAVDRPMDAAERERLVAFALGLFGLRTP